MMYLEDTRGLEVTLTTKQRTFDEFASPMTPFRASHIAIQNYQ